MQNLLDDSREEALMAKLNELENYLATNPNKYTQNQNPMGIVGVQNPAQVMNQG